MSQSVAIGLSEFALVALRGEERDDGRRVQEQIARAVRYYLSEKDPERPGWPYPAFLRGREEGGAAKLEFEIDEATWRSFESEAARQEVSAVQLAEHAVLYFVAELNAGRVKNP